MDKALPHPHSHLFTVRLWWEELGDGQAERRGSVQHVLSGELCYFRDWSTLIDFLIAMLHSRELHGSRSGGMRRLNKHDIPNELFIELQRRPKMGDLEHIRGQFPSLELARADVEKDGFHPVPFEHPKAGTFKTHCHPIDETVYLLRGSMTFTVAGKPYMLSLGDKLRLPALTPHSVVVEAGTMYLMGWSEMITWEEFRAECPPDPNSP